MVLWVQVSGIYRFVGDRNRLPSSPSFAYRRRGPIYVEDDGRGANR